MADFTALKTAIQNAIKQNGNEEITGNLLQEVLLAIVTTLGDGSINDLITALDSEATIRGNADITLQQNIDAEAQARGNADITLQQNIDAEAQARGNADTALGGRIDDIVSSIEAINDAIENGYVYAGIATPSSTPTTGKVFYLALTAGTYTNFGNTAVTQGINILKYNGSAWSLDTFVGIDDTPTPNSPNLVKSGGAFDSVMTNGSAFDISAHFASGGTLATYADLDAALVALNTLSASYKRGGMSIKFVQSSDNKYVQYRLMADEFTTDVTQWQGVDDEPTAGSKNLIESGGVYAETNGNKVELSGSTYTYENAYYRNLLFGYTIKSGTIIKFLSDNTYLIPVDGSGNIYVENTSVPYTLAKDIKGIIPTIANAGYVVFEGEIEKLLLQDTKKVYLPETGLDSSHGSYTNNADLASTLSIPVSEGDIITSEFTMYRIAQFNENKEFISPLIDPSSTSYTIPSGVRYIRINFNKYHNWYGWIKKNGKYITAEILKQFDNISIANATTSKSGLMSASDKTKLDAIPNGGYDYNISVEGSGITKNASAFGFLPSKTADENFTALQTAVNGGGTILIDMPGEYALCGTILIPSNTTLVFGNNVFIRYAPNSNGVYSYYIFLNAGAESRTYNENIKIIGLTLNTEGVNPTGGQYWVAGLRGYLSFFYVKHLLIEDCHIYDDKVSINNFNIHICTFEDVVINRVRITSGKDGLHFGRGKGLVISNGYFNTGDDPIALNAQDYSSANPEFGWIEDVIIENIWDENRDSATYPTGRGRTINILGGAWKDWENGATYLTYGGMCVYNNRIYKTDGSAGTAVASVPPSNTTIGSISEGADGLRWRCMQVFDGDYTAGIKNLVVDNLYLNQARVSVFNIYYENNPSYVQSYTPNAPLAIYKNFTFKNIIQNAFCETIFGGSAPILNIKFENSFVKSDTIINVSKIDAESPTYPETKLVMDGITFDDSVTEIQFIANVGRSIDVKTYGSFILGVLTATKEGIVTTSSNDIGLS